MSADAVKAKYIIFFKFIIFSCLDINISSGKRRRGGKGKKIESVVLVQCTTIEIDDISNGRGTGPGML